MGAAVVEGAVVASPAVVGVGAPSPADSAPSSPPPRRARAATTSTTTAITATAPTGMRGAVPVRPRVEVSVGGSIAGSIGGVATAGRPGCTAVASGGTAPAGAVSSGDTARAGTIGSTAPTAGADSGVGSGGGAGSAAGEAGGADAGAGGGMIAVTDDGRAAPTRVSVARTAPAVGRPAGSLVSSRAMIGDEGPGALVGPRLAVHDGRGGGEGGTRQERRVALDGEVQQRPERPQVGGRRDVAARRLLGRHVRGRADDEARHGHP